jgi:Bacterial Ig-like domain (group 3)/Pro-kumamolisin, activation domain
MRKFIATPCTRVFLLIAALCVFASWPALAQTSSSTEEGSLTLPNHIPSKVANGTATLVGHYNPGQMLRLVLTVQAPHMAEEEQFIKALLTKGSPGFHKFLTQDEWNTRFGPSVEDEQAVVDWAQSVGLTVTKRYPNRLLVDVEATAGTIEKAFGVTINNYQVGKEVDFSNDRNPVIPANLSGILSFVTGLSNVERPHRIGSSHPTVKGADYVPGPPISEGESAYGAGDPTKAPWARPAAIKSRAAAKAAKNDSGAPSNPNPHDSYPLDDMNGTYAMDPDNVQSSNGYDYNALQKLSFCCNEPGAASSPPESSIALVGYGGFNTSDVETFFGKYGMAYSLTWYCIGGSACPGNDGEAPLDVEYSGAMSNSYGAYQDTASIYEYEMTNNLYTTYEDAFNDVLSDGHAKVVSTSYGWEENVGFSGTIATGTMHPIFNNMIGAGITLIAASGDNGASDGCGNATAVDYPSSDPDFIAAGGTQLNMYTNGIFYSETAWQGETWSGACSHNHGGSTGGVSVLFTAPSWQTTTTNSTYPNGVVSPFYLWKNGSEYVETGNTYRMVPDIALTANPDVLGEWYVSGGTWQDEGGTSIVAPELAGFFAQENSYLDYIGDICGSGTTACSPVGAAAPFFYYNAIDGAPHNPFYDMLSGCSNNDVTAANSLFYYCAYTGYDPITGWGSANMMQLAWGINWELIPADGVPALSFGGPATNTWFNTDQIIDWDLSDGSSDGFTPPGVAGFTLGWDSIPTDSYSEPHGGDGDTFYTGPEYTYSSFGCVDNNGTYCQAASGQGCHTVYVRGWDNQGIVTNGSYGPVCFDSVPPTIGASTNPPTSVAAWVNKPVVVTLTATDPGGSEASGIKKTYYAINSGSCIPTSVSTCSVYSAPFTISTQGQSYVYYFTEDNAGNFSSEPYIWVSIDTTKPVTTATLSGTLNGSYYQNSVQVTLTATDNLSGVASTVYEVNGGAWTTYSAPFTLSQDGAYTVKYYSTDNAGNVEVTKTVTFGITDTTTTVLVSSLNPSGSGKLVTFTATVTPFAGTATGSVAFKDGATVLATKALSGGKAIFSTSTLAGGSHSITASFLGSTYFLTSASSALIQVVENSSSTAITSSANPSQYGEAVTLTATITHSGVVPTGTVTFKSGSTVLAAVAVGSAGTATYTTSALTVATHSITAVYSGDSNYAGSTSPVFAQVVQKAATSTSLVSSLNPSVFGEKITLTATVQAVAPGAGTPIGTVHFMDGATLLGSHGLVAGVAAFPELKLAPGSHTITAVYVAGADFNTSTSNAVSEVVDQASTKTTVVSSLNPSTSGATVTFTATVVAVAPGVGTPTGTVTFKDGTTTLGTGTLNSSKKATLAISTLAEGTHSITAVYGGDSDFIGSTSAALSQKVNP